MSSATPRSRFDAVAEEARQVAAADERKNDTRGSCPCTWWLLALVVTSFIIALGLAVFLLWLGIEHSDSACDVPLASYARGEGAIWSVVAGLLAVVAALDILNPRKLECWRTSLAASLCAACLLLTMLLAWLGVKIYGSILLYADALYSRMQSPSPPCADDLYWPLSTYMIISWVVPVLALVLLVLGAAIMIFLSLYREAVASRERSAAAKQRRGLGSGGDSDDEDGAADADESTELRGRPEGLGEEAWRRAGWQGSRATADPFGVGYDH